ncbi:hypothetical protein GYB70_12935 [Sinorhizobium meliloti]|nr:hypothetical protein [Sinorhizobium meliloti]
MTDLSCMTSETCEADRVKLGALSAEVEETDDLLAGLATPKNACDEAKEAVEDEHERTVAILFPQQAVNIHDISELTIPVRDILTWFAEHNEAEREVIIAMRDDFYGGDDSFDYCYGIVPNFNPLTAEQRAEARVARAETRARRTARHAELEAEDREHLANEAAMWAPFVEEKAVLEAEREANCDRADALEAEWDAFVIKWKSYKDPDEMAKAAERAVLEAKGEVLRKAQDVWEDSWIELQDRAWRELESSRSDIPRLGAGAHH